MADISGIDSDLSSVYTPPPVAAGAAPQVDSAGQPISSGDIVVHAPSRAPKVAPAAPPNEAKPINPEPSPNAPVSDADKMDQDFNTILSGKSLPAYVAPPQEPEPEAPFYNPNPVPISSVPGDVAKSAVSGLEQGTAGLIGLPGSAADLLNKPADWAFAHAISALGLSGSQNADQVQAQLAARRQANPYNAILPNAQNLATLTQKIAGPFYQPKTVPGQYAKTIGEFAPGAVVGGGGGLNVLANAVLPGVGSETLGQATKGTGLEPYARVVGGIGGGALTAMGGAGVGASKGLFSGAPDIAAAEAAQRAGVAMPAVGLSTRPAEQGIAMGLKSAPIVGTPIRQASDTAMQQIGEAAQIAAKIPTGAVVAPEEAGQSIRQGLEDYIGPTSEAKVSDLYNKVGAKVNPATATPLANTQKAVSEIAAERAAARLPGNGKAVDHVFDAVQDPSGLTFDGIKTLRTSVREMLKPGRLPADMSGTELKRIYVGLSKDLKESVSRSGGPDAVAAFQRANRYSGLVAERRKALDSILGHTKSNEGVAATVQRLAGEGSTANIKLLRAARRSVSADEWNDVVSSTIGKMGLSDKGEFSGDRFLTAYGKISPQAKDVLFSSTGLTSSNALGKMQTLRQSLDDIATLSRRMAQLQKFANTSKTTDTATALGEVGAMYKAIVSGGFVEPLTVIGGLLGGRGLAAYLSRPVTAKMISDWTRRYANVPRTVAGARSLGDATKTLIGRLATVQAAPDINDFGQEQRRKASGQN